MSPWRTLARIICSELVSGREFGDPGLVGTARAGVPAADAPRASGRWPREAAPAVGKFAVWNPRKSWLDPYIANYAAQEPQLELVFSKAGQPVDPGTKASYQDELAIGIEKALDPTLSNLRGSFVPDPSTPTTVSGRSAAADRGSGRKSLRFPHAVLRRSRLPQGPVAQPGAPASRGAQDRLLTGPRRIPLDPRTGSGV